MDNLTSLEEGLFGISHKSFVIRIVTSCFRVSKDEGESVKEIKVVWKNKTGVISYYPRTLAPDPYEEFPLELIASTRVQISSSSTSLSYLSLSKDRESVLLDGGFLGAMTEPFWGLSEVAHFSRIVPREELLLNCSQALEDLRNSEPFTRGEVDILVNCALELTDVTYTNTFFVSPLSLGIRLLSLHKEGSEYELFCHHLYSIVMRSTRKRRYSSLSNRMMDNPFPKIFDVLARGLQRNFPVKFVKVLNLKENSLCKLLSGERKKGGKLLRSLPKEVAEEIFFLSDFILPFIEEEILMRYYCVLLHLVYCTYSSGNGSYGFIGYEPYVLAS